MSRPLLGALPLLLALSCAQVKRDDPAEGTQDGSAPAFASAAVDPHSHARLTSVRVTHVALDLTADFAERTLAGTVTLAFDRPEPDDALVLDAGTSVEIQRVTAADGSARPYHVSEPDPHLGRALRIPLQPGDASVTVRYRTLPDAAAVQWLTPEQTAGGTAPFLFTQGQAILTRTWIPLQDSPGIRVTYEATIRTPGRTDLVALMSAREREVVEPGVTRFAMPHPIPSYLIALAIGDLEERAISERCAVWAEPPVVERAARELEDVDAMLRACEELYGSYPWGRYDVLVLPPSFPFGGMENPCLTFATPTILAGDKSLVALIAHELAHSWSGNLVTNATWSDFWLNEGFTVYVEQRIVERLYGAERARMETLHGLHGLERELATLPPADQVLHVELEGRDPDDGMTAVPYDKGAAFLRRLEQVFGRERFDRFLDDWFRTHAFRSVTTADFRRFLEDELLAEDPEKAAQIDVELWIEGPGLPDDAPRPESDAFARVDVERERFLAGASASELATDGFVTMQWLHFLNGLPDDVAVERLADLDAAFGLSASGNSEILAAFLAKSIAAADGVPESPGVRERLRAFLLEVGRRKFLKPLYEALARSASGKTWARALYTEARSRYHAVSTRTIDEILGWPY